MRALVILSVMSAACASTVDGSRRDGLDAATTMDVPPGRNADGLDPFRPADVLVSADASSDVSPWDLRDATVFDQRLASFGVGLYANSGAPTSYFSASFRLFPRPDDPRCEYVAAGTWSVQQCRLDGSAPRDPHPTPFPSAGELRLVGGTRDLVTRPGTTGLYSAQSTSEPVLRDGSVVTLRAAGSAAVPAFSLTVPIPPALTITAPPLGGMLDLSRNEDLVLTWVPISARLVTATLQFTLSGSPSRSVRVDVQAPADAGRLVIPARVLQRVEVMPNGLSGSFSVQSSNFVLGRAGLWPIQVTAVGRGASQPVRLR